MPRFPAAALLSALLLAGCASPDPPPPEPERPPVAPGGPWASPGFHIAGTIPDGWTRHPSEEAVVALSSDRGEIALKVTVVDATFVRPDEDVLVRILEDRWKKSSTCTFDLFGASAARGDFISEDGKAASTHVMWEWNEGATPGRKFVFHAMLVCARDVHAQMLPGFEAFMEKLEPDLDGPDIEIPELALAGGWAARSLPKERALVFARCRVPAVGDPFVNREIPVAGWLDVCDRLRDKRSAKEKLSNDEEWQEATARYNLAVHMIWSQVGAPADKREGARWSSQQFLRLWARMNAALAASTSVVVKLKAFRDGRPWGDAARMHWNATVLEALAVYLKDGEIDVEARAGLLAAAAAPACDYRDLAYAWWAELEPASVEKAVGFMAEVKKAFTEKRFEDAGESAREALAATGGRWPEAHRAIAAAEFEAGNVLNAAGAARSAVTALPGSANLLLEQAEILVAANRPEDALAVLAANDGLIRDSLRDNAMVLEALRAMAWERKGEQRGAQGAIEELLKMWREGGSTAIAWDFGALSRALGEAEPAKGRLAAIAELLEGRGTQEGVLSAWGVPK
ncbi:MAG: hypothetical protein FD180_2774 [Planctomycetota bacterium]|nr:MAG: hypothetical protein FD180_2774 [Planctomycetota bacterium]